MSASDRVFDKIGPVIRRAVTENLEVEIVGAGWQERVNGTQWKLRWNECLCLSTADVKHLSRDEHFLVLKNWRRASDREQLYWLELRILAENITEIRSYVPEKLVDAVVNVQDAQ